MQPFLNGIDPVPSFGAFAPYRPANVHLPRGLDFGPWPSALGIAFANTGGQDSGSDGAEPFPLSNAGTLAAGVAGVNYADSSDMNAEFNKIVTALVLRNLVENLRDDLVVMQNGAFLHAKHVPGTKEFVYTFFADLGAAEDLLEGVPPETVPLTWDTQSFSGGQKGKVVAITDLAELFSPFDLYSQAAAKVAWNAIETAEQGAVDLLLGATGLTGGTGKGSIAANVVDAVVVLKQGNVPRFPDGYYHCLISPGDAGQVMIDTDDAGWTAVEKYADAQTILNGELGRFRGVRFIESNRITDGNSIVFGPGMVVWGDYQTIQSYRVAPGGDHADPLSQRGLVGWKGMWGMKINEFDGTPAIGPASNTKGLRFLGPTDLTSV